MGSAGGRPAAIAAEALREPAAAAEDSPDAWKVDLSPRPALPLLDQVAVGPAFMNSQLKDDRLRGQPHGLPPSGGRVTAAFCCGRATHLGNRARVPVPASPATGGHRPQRWRQSLVRGRVRRLPTELGPEGLHERGGNAPCRRRRAARCAGAWTEGAVARVSRAPVEVLNARRSPGSTVGADGGSGSAGGLRLDAGGGPRPRRPRP